MINRRERRAALLVAGCLFMELLDGTIVTTSAPQISRSLAVAPGAVGLLITAYFVTVAALMPVSGWVSARWGARPVFLQCETKETDVAEHLRVLGHVGLLVNGLPGTAGPPFI